MSEYIFTSMHLASYEATKVHSVVFFLIHFLFFYFGV